MLSSGNRAMFFSENFAMLLLVLKDLDIVAQYNWKSLLNRTATLSFANQAQCTMCLSSLDSCIREICSFAPIFQGNNCFRAKYLDNNFHF